VLNFFLFQSPSIQVTLITTIKDCNFHYELTANFLKDSTEITIITNELNSTNYISFHHTLIFLNSAVKLTLLAFSWATFFPFHFVQVRNSKFSISPLDSMSHRWIRNSSHLPCFHPYLRSFQESQQNNLWWSDFHWNYFHDPMHFSYKDLYFSCLLQLISKDIFKQVLVPFSRAVYSDEWSQMPCLQWI